MKGIKLNKKIIFISFILIALLTFNIVNRNITQKIYFKSAGELLNSAAYQQAVLIDDNEVLITGGLVSGDIDIKTGSKTAWIYSLKDKKIKKIADMNLKHLFHKAFKMQDENIAIADINGIEIFDIKTKKFKLLKTKPMERYKEFYNYKCSLLPDDLLVILGGRTAEKQKNGATSTDLNTGEIIDLKNDKLIKKFKIKGNGFGIVNLSNGNLLIIGGKEKTNDSERLSNAIYILDSKTFNLTQWGELPVSITNPFCFLTKDNKIIIIGGEIFKKYEKWKNFNYVHTKGSDNIYILDLDTKKTVSKNLKFFFKNEDFNNDPIGDNFIVDIIKYDDKTYLLDLGKKQDSFVFLNIDDLTIKKIPGFRSSLFRYSTISFQGKIFLFGGKISYNEGPNEYVIGEQQHPFAIDELLPNGDGFFINNIQYVEYKK